MFKEAKFLHLIIEGDCLSLFWKLRHLGIEDSFAGCITHDILLLLDSLIILVLIALLNDRVINSPMTLSSGNLLAIGRDHSLMMS